MFSEAFLTAYEGDLEGAYRSYQRASPRWLIPLDEEPDKPWLYYCLGLLNHRGKGDLEAARADFTRFVETADRGRFNKQIDIAEKWVREIDAILTT